MDNKWAALRTIAAVFKVLAYVEGFFMVIRALGVLFAVESAWILLYVLLGGAVGFLFLYATAEAILVFISIEENTKKSAEALEGKKSE